MPDTYPPDRPTPRYKLAALSIVGAAMVALPLAQVLRYQDTELQAALAEQAGLDPVRRAVAVQQGLLAHRDVAGQVLRGQVVLENERRKRQHKVDERVVALAGALVVASERTHEEFSALRDDWALLARDVQERTVSASESDLAHRLLVEQTLQVIDFIADASGLGRDRDSGAALLASVMTRSLPRLAAEIAALKPAGGAAGSGHDERQLAATEATLARVLGRLNEAVEHAVVPRPALAEATAEAGASADRYFRLLRDGSPESVQADAAALQAQFLLLEATHAVVAETLAGRVDGARREREVLLALTAVLALLSVWILIRMFMPARSGAKRLRTDPRQHGDAAEGTQFTAATASPPGSADSRGEAGRLLQRLRRHDGGPGPTPLERDTPAETLPPEQA
ncbi:MAG: hypothetical protein Q8M01_14910 [Rubrivivax sp.]|nr:hypothetical protein [Rubrivivax sp.]